MLTGLFAFLGGSGFRMIFGEVAAFFQKKQEKETELELMRLQGTLEGERHSRDMERLKLQSELGVKEIQVKGDIDITKIDAESFQEAQKQVAIPTGILWIDGWNGIIRPLAASIALFLWVFALNQAGFHMTDFDKELVGGIIGFWFGHRVMVRNGK